MLREQRTASLIRIPSAVMGVRSYRRDYRLRTKESKCPSPTLVPILGLFQCRIVSNATPPTPPPERIIVTFVRRPRIPSRVSIMLNELYGVFGEKSAFIRDLDISTTEIKVLINVWSILKIKSYWGLKFKKGLFYDIQYSRGPLIRIWEDWFSNSN